MSAATLDDLSDDELRARLTARRLPAGVVDALVADRDTAGGRFRIEEALDG